MVYAQYSPNHHSLILTHGLCRILTKSSLPYFDTWFMHNTHQVVHGIGQFAIVEQDKPASLPSLQENEKKTSLRSANDLTADINDLNGDVDHLTVGVNITDNDFTDDIYIDFDLNGDINYYLNGDVAITIFFEIELNVIANYLIISFLFLVPMT